MIILKRQDFILISNLPGYPSVSHPVPTKENIHVEKHTVCFSGQGAEDFAHNILWLLEMFGKAARLNLGHELVSIVTVKMWASGEGSGDTHWL